MQGISNLRNLTRLNLCISRNQVESNKAKILAQGVTNLINLTHLELDIYWYQTIDLDGTKAIGQSISNLTNLTHLFLMMPSGDNEITAPVLQAIAQGVSSLVNLTSFRLNLGLRHTNIHGAKALVTGINNLPNLSHLYIRLQKYTVYINDIKKIEKYIKLCNENQYEEGWLRQI